MQKILQSFLAFNQNAAAYLIYTISNNLWFLLIAAGIVGCIVLSIREEVVVTVKEEQQAL